MKGIVFSEFVEMVETRFGAEMADAIITGAQLQSGGSYTAVGTYDHHEMLALIGGLSGRTGMPPGELVRAFGAHLFGRFAELYPTFFDNVGSAFDFLARIENHVHMEVVKLYPDAELPTFDITRPDPATLQMVYKSGRPFADLALGLMQGCAAHYGEDIAIEEVDLSQGARTHSRFTLKRR